MDNGDKYEDVVSASHSIMRMEGCEGVFCKCGLTLHIRTPENKGWHSVKCPVCGFVASIYCGKH